MGIIHPVLNNDFSASLFCSALITEIMKELDKEGIDVIPGFAFNRHNSSSNIRRLTRQQKVDAFIIVDSDVPAEDYQFMEKHSIPYIQLHYRPRFYSPDSIRYVFSDNLTGGLLATDHLIEHGCKNIMCISIKSERPEILDRREGFFRSMSSHGLRADKNLVFEEECSFFSGERVIRENLDTLHEVDGIFVHADIMALGAVKELERSGLRVPEDIKIVGYDDIELGTYFSPGLTTVHQPKEILAVKACSTITGIIKNGSGTQFLQEVVKPSLVVRKSS